jgi:hypothetical protein
MFPAVFFKKKKKKMFLVGLLNEVAKAVSRLAQYIYPK